jgi:hypothetical protein
LVNWVIGISAGYWLIVDGKLFTAPSSASLVNPAE